MRAFVAAALSLAVVAGAGCPLGPGAGEPGAGEGEGEGDPGTPDGTPDHRRACTNSFGDAVTAEYGRVDGFLAAVVPTTTSGCRADPNHLHLQIDVGGSIVDVAVNLDVSVAERDVPPVQAWDEGWHPGVTFDYVRDLATHAADLSTASPGAVQTQVLEALSDANHVSLYARGYDVDGLHDVHRNGAQRDGAIVAKPTEGTARYLIFRFSDQQF